MATVEFFHHFSFYNIRGGYEAEDMTDPSYLSEPGPRAQALLRIEVLGFLQSGLRRSMPRVGR